MTSILRIEDLCVSYGRNIALDHVSLSLNEGELLIVLGPIGSGKTTLLRTIAGLQKPDRGTITLEGLDASHLTPSQRDVAMVFQNFSLYPDRTVRQNLSFPLESPSSSLTKPEIDERVEWAALLLHIDHLLDRPATQLAGGEMQRVAIGRAIVRRPRLFLFDEPLTNLDAKLRERLRVELISLLEDLGVPAIYVTHDQAEALSMADRIAVLSDGSICQTGTPEDIYTHPCTPGIARQLGYPPINIIDVEQRDGTWQAGGLPLTTASADKPSARLGIRPENILPKGGQSEARIQVVEDLGPSRILLVEWASLHLHILTDRKRDYAPGDVIKPSIREDSVIVWTDSSKEEDA